MLAARMAEGITTRSDAGRVDGERSRPSVALVEDDPTVAEVYRLGLEALGFKVDVFSDGSKFFSALDAHVPDVAVLDWQLQSILTGVDIIENLRLDERTSNLPVVMLSNHSDVGDGVLDRAIEAGAREWLIKAHTTPTKLAQRLRLILRLGSRNHVERRGNGDRAGSDDQ
jgi:DNA-binding response OmpR family regulator